VKRNRSDDDEDVDTDDGERDASSSVSKRTTTRRAFLACAIAVFAVALCVRLLMWRETRAEVGKVQTVVTTGYIRDARVLVEDGFASLFSRQSPLAQPDSLGHPPGYPLLVALIFKTFSDSDACVQFVSIACDSLSVVLLFLIVAELLNLQTALIAGLSAALSPQLAWNSVLLLPDSLAVLPLLCAIYVIARATNQTHDSRRVRFSTIRSRCVAMLAAGALVGVSCWLRANALLLAPFVALFVLFLSDRARRLPLAASLVAGAVVIVGILTIRNAVVFRSFVPVSLGAGQTLLEGIGDYDKSQRFGLPATDDEIMQQEADVSNRPDYRDSLLGVDGIARERARMRRGFSVISAHPFWFVSVVLRRAASMLRLERTRRVSDQTGVGIVQRLFITALFLPLALAGAFILARSQRRRALAFLSVVPAYYLCVQSIFHTEYRYTLALTYFLFALAAVALSTSIKLLRQNMLRRAGES
jgi:4-amino-4-deoxy-L-arabinose transferase-like glycosyltransferase